MIRKNSSPKGPKRSPRTPKPARGAAERGRARKEPARGAAERASQEPARKAAPRKRPSSVRADVKPAPELSPQRRRQLRAQAHSLEPIVLVGHGGVSEAVVHAVKRALVDHELIKVRLHEPENKQAMAELLAQGSRAALCGLIGHTVILFRPKPKPVGLSGVARTAIKRNRLKPNQPKRSTRGR